MALIVISAPHVRCGFCPSLDELLGPAPKRGLAYGLGLNPSLELVLGPAAGAAE
jgi:hypothetical protein